MKSTMDKHRFINVDAINILSNASPDTPARWGKMNLQQTVEHLADFFNVSASKLVFPIVTPAEQLPAYKAFLLSDKMFRENTKAPADIVSEEPQPERYADLKTAIDILKASLIAFEQHFSSDKTRTTAHPVFGELNYDEWILLHYKHVHHHLKQFGLIS